MFCGSKADLRRRIWATPGISSAREFAGSRLEAGATSCWLRRLVRCFRAGGAKRCVAARGENKIENAGDGLRETRGGIFVDRCWEQCEIDCAAGAGDECAWECGAFGDVLKVREEGGVMAGKNADLENDGCRRSFKKHCEAFAKASPDGGARRVTEDGGGSGARFFCEQSEFARVAIEDFGGAREGRAELPLARVKPVADGLEGSLIRSAVFSGEDGSLRRGWSSRGEDLG